jgi:hypothetical protein
LKLLFASPTYGPPSDPSFARSHRIAIMHAAANGVQWLGDVSTDRIGFAGARNRVAKEAIEFGDDADGIFWVDDDILLPKDAITRLLEHGLDCVSGLYFQRQPPYLPMISQLTSRESFANALVYKPNVIAPVDGIGFGCVYTSLNMIREVSELPESQEHGPFGGEFGNRTYGEDYTFCLRAAKLGYRPHVDTGILCKHYIEPRFADEALFLKTRGEIHGAF